MDRLRCVAGHIRAHCKGAKKMSCWRRTTVLRIPASALGFQLRRQWDAFLKLHTRDFRWETGFFNESLCDYYPWILMWGEADFENPDWHLGQRNPEYPEVVPGPFLDYHLDEIRPLPPELNGHGDHNKALPLEEAELEEYLPLFRRLIPHFTRKEMEAVRWCEYDWYDGSNPPYLYSDWD